METNNQPISDGSNDLIFENNDQQWSLDCTDDKDKKKQEDDDEDSQGDWGNVDPLEHPGPSSDMDPSAPGSAV